MSDDLEAVDVKSLKVVELKEELSKRGLETKGLKKDLADRLRTAQDLALSGGTELAAPTDEIKDQAVHPHHASASPASPLPDGDGVGHPMVEGAPEAIEEIHEKVEDINTKKAEEAEPAVLDEEVAEVVAKEEAKDDLPPTPPPLQAISPLSVGKELELEIKEDHKDDEDMEVEESAEQDEKAESPATVPKSPPRIPTPQAESPVSEKEELTIESVERSKINDREMERGDIPTPPLPTTGLPSEDGLDRPKRGRSESSSVPEPTKRPRKAYTTPLPASLSHLLHPPTFTLYITNLKRPLVHAALHEYLFPTSSPPSDRLPSPKPPFASSDHPNLWLSGVKDHAYATYPTVEAALVEAERIEAEKWPEETGEKLHVEFVPDELVRGLVDREEFAWANGRQKLILRIRPSEDSGGEASFELQGSGSIGSTPRMGRPGAATSGLARPPLIGTARPVQPPLSGTNAIRPPVGTPTGPSAGLGLGIRGRALPPHLARPSNGDLPIRPGPGVGFGRGGAARPAEGRLVNRMRRTKVRPGLFWKEGPGAVRK